MGCGECEQPRVEEIARRNGQPMRIGRNQPCSCGSGKKYKHCCAHARNELSEHKPTLALPVRSANKTPTRVRHRRDCDGCTACCTAPIINDPDLVLFGGEPCLHLCANGCAIYREKRPRSCESYVCNYLLEPGNITVDERPDRVGAIVRIVEDRRMSPPMDTTVHVNECAPGGLLSVLRNRVWGGVARRALLAGNPILFTWIEDPRNREAINVCFFDGKLGCELTSCQPDGSSILRTVEPVYDKPIEIAVLIPNQGFALDSQLLVHQLGDRELMVIGSSTSSASATELRFLFTRHQAELIEALGVLVPLKGARGKHGNARVFPRPS